MIRELMVNVAKNIPAIYTAKTAMVTGMGVQIDLSKKQLILPAEETAENIYFVEKERVPEGIYAGVANLSDYFEQFVKVKEGEFAKAIPNYEGEMYGTDQYDDSVVQSAVDKYLAVGTDGKWKVASASISSCYKLAGFQADGVNKIAQIVKLADAGQNS